MDRPIRLDMDTGEILLAPYMLHYDCYNKLCSRDYRRESGNKDGRNDKRISAPKDVRALKFIYHSFSPTSEIDLTEDERIEEALYVSELESKDDKYSWEKDDILLECIKVYKKLTRDIIYDALESTRKAIHRYIKFNNKIAEKIDNDLENLDKLENDEIASGLDMINKANANAKSFKVLLETLMDLKSKYVENKKDNTDNYGEIDEGEDF